MPSTLAFVEVIEAAAAGQSAPAWACEGCPRFADYAPIEKFFDEIVANNLVPAGLVQVPKNQPRNQIGDAPRPSKPVVAASPEPSSSVLPLQRSLPTSAKGQFAKPSL